MIDLPNIEEAAGLSAGDRAVLSELVEVSRSVAARNRELDLYYEGEQQTPDIGIDNIPRQVDPGVRCDWARKAVTSVSERVRMDGFVFEGDYEDEGFARIARENSLDAEFNRNVASELTHGCMFATVNRIGERVAIRMHTAEDSAAIWDVANQRIGAGMVVAALFTALISLVKYVADPQDVLPQITFWLMGALSGATVDRVLAGAPLILIALVALELFAWRLNVTTLSPDEAKSLGIPLARLRAGGITAATLLTASVVSLCGLIGWVGLLVPHAARLLFGSDNRYVLPASMVLGALFMLVVDTLARTVSEAEIPVSILTAVIGAPFFILLLRRTQGGVR